MESEEKGAGLELPCKRWEGTLSPDRLQGVGRDGEA